MMLWLFTHLFPFVPFQCCSSKYCIYSTQFIHCDILIFIDKGFSNVSSQFILIDKFMLFSASQWRHLLTSSLLTVYFQLHLRSSFIVCQTVGSFKEKKKVQVETGNDYKQSDSTYSKELVWNSNIYCIRRWLSISQHIIPLFQHALFRSIAMQPASEKNVSESLKG